MMAEQRSLVRPCSNYRVGKIVEDAQVIAQHVREGHRTRDELEKCYCIRCQYALEILDMEARS